MRTTTGTPNKPRPVHSRSPHGFFLHRRFPPSVGRGSHLMVRAAPLLLSVLLTGCSHLVRAPVLDPAQIVGAWPTATDDAATLELIQAEFAERFSYAPADLIGDCGGCALEPDGTTAGIAEISASVQLQLPKGAPEGLRPAVAALSPQAQQALFASGDDTRSPTDVASLLSLVMTKKRPPPRPNYLRPTYALRIHSELYTSNVYDRFERVATLIVLDTQQAPGAIIASYGAVADSEIEANFGKIERSESTTLKATANISSPLPIEGATAGLTGEYQKQFSEKLIRDLSEKILTTSNYPPARPQLASHGLWVVQRGHKDHKLRHSLAQTITLDLSPVSTGLAIPHYGWKVASDKLQPDPISLPGRTVSLAAHVMSLGVVRHIRSERAPWVFNETHTVEEGDDRTTEYVVTDYQHLLLPVARPRLFHVIVEGGVELSIVADTTAPPDFWSQKDAQAFAVAIRKASWQDPGAGCTTEQRNNGIPRCQVRTTVMGLAVWAEGVSDASSARSAMSSVHIVEDAWR